MAIFWVNHRHHCFSRVVATDWPVLWANNLLLFFLTVVPFTTAVLGDHPGQPVAVAVYAANLTLAGGSFSLMGWYVFFKRGLLDERIGQAERRREWTRSWLATGLYAAAAVLAFAWLPVALLVIAILPLIFVIPNLLSGADA